MASQEQRLRLMHVHAHPDDESSKGAASTARYVAEGVQVLVVTCTGGERGSILNPKMERPEVQANLPAIRRAEMERARDILGVQHRWLGYPDSGYPDRKPPPPPPEGSFAAVPLAESTRRLVQIMREFRPHVVTTYDESGGYPHPDHIRCHEVTIAAWEASGDPDSYPEDGQPWHPLKLYYHFGFHRARLEALHAELVRRGLDSPYAERLEKWQADPAREARLTTRVPCGDYFAVRDQALLAHATQIDPDGRWFSVPIDAQVAAWPTEDFQLARSLVDVQPPEDDLFTGVRELLAAADGHREPALEAIRDRACE